MAAYINNIVDPAHNPEIALLVATRAVAREVNPVDLRPILLFVTLVVTPDGPEHRWPRPLDDEIAALVCGNGLSGARHYIGVDTRERFCSGAGFGGRGAGNRSDHDCAGLSLPPGIDNRTTVFADHLAIPHPRLGVDRFTDRAEQAQARKVMLHRPVLTPLDKRPDRSRSSVENVYAMALDHGPEAIGLGKVRGAFVH